jgi:hypothetical protein
MSDALWTIVQQCWSHEVAERPSMARVVEMMQDANEELRIVVSLCAFSKSLESLLITRSQPLTMPFLQQIPRTPPGTKQTFQVHRPSRRRPKAQGPNSTVYQSLSY